MSVVINVDTPLCDHSHKIETEKRGDKVKIDIDTTCDRVENASDLTVTTEDILGRSKNDLYSKLNRFLEEQCFVLPAVITACRLEAGLISKRLAKKTNEIEIKFEEVK
ncbi:MAG: hypothetical protein BTN85_0873 [Candidatus Methanohalarchaeum thermophilum]|uniref:Uncharacterized protein n=1 Tax=Methanohalarchaeum thermophilum TaxID=1903181 RepID=A0A1Q6DVP3_METT1|nr:MAG: hypothetical protein BTN85_0873 [Candidatus Methanohalarchaeum thermophilum]